MIGRLVPGWAWPLGLVAVALGLATWHLLEVDAALERGRAQMRAQWSAVELARAERARAERQARAWWSIEQSKAHEAQRAAIAATLTEARHALRSALSAPISCPAAPDATVGDFVVPGAVLRRVRDAAAGTRAGQRAD